MSLQGYKGRLKDILIESGCSVGDDVSIETDSGSIEGILMPRYQYGDENNLVIKMKNGYNIGISYEKIKGLRLINKGKEPSFRVPPKPKTKPSLAKVLILGTGGTIASRIDYRTGGVKAALTSEELYHLVPELSDIADIETQVAFNIYSENMTPHHWSELASKVADGIMNGYDGIVITHGTDTMHFTSAALSFALQGTPIPIVLVGSQRSSDRPSSDSATNLIGAVRFASSSIASGVFVIMHHGPGDDRLAIHSGVRVRKLHTSRRDAFKSVDAEPVGFIEEDKITINEPLAKRAYNHNFTPKTNFSDKVSLMKIYPGFDSSLISKVVESGVKGIILEGTGLGHAPSSSFEEIKNAVEKGVLVCMTSQCIYGSVRMTVYETGRDLLHIGVIPLSDMLSEVAYAKLSWLLGQNLTTNEIAIQMKSNLVGEIRGRRLLW
jgi:glutamyl-tRNA(Gln) amidotransferase subunit D